MLSTDVIHHICTQTMFITKFSQYFSESESYRMLLYVQIMNNKFSFLILEFTAYRSFTSSTGKSILKAQQVHKNLISHIKMKWRTSPPMRGRTIMEIVCSKMKISSYFHRGPSQNSQKRTFDASRTSTIHPRSQSVEVIQMKTGNTGSKQMQTVSIHISTFLIVPDYE